MDGTVMSEFFRGLLFELEPDYSRPLLQVPPESASRMRERLRFLYGAEAEVWVWRELERLMRVHFAHETPELIDAERRFDPRERFTERDVVLITYGDMIVSRNRRPLQTLADFTERFFRGLVTTLHILPFYPYSSDRGFSVISYEEVDPRLGSWEEIEELESQFTLMMDAVFNHVSSRSYWFRQFLDGAPDYQDFFIVFHSKAELDDDQLRMILRPRTSSPLTPYLTIDGPKWVWTTFSADQVDLNFKNPKVLLKVVEILLFYVRKGADLLRLDAIAYLWCILGTPCAHLRQTHETVKLFRDILDVVSPHVALITETNVPHEDNVSYFGNGRDEAQMVYNFALPPLVLHAFITGDAGYLTRWAAGLEPPSELTSFFNFLDSHDGIGLLGARGILPDEEIDRLCRHTEERGGKVSMRADGEKGQVPYELNITWFSALERRGDEPEEWKIARFLASRAVALIVRGVPGIYLPGFFGSRNDLEAVLREGSARAINRPALEEAKLLATFSDPGSVHSRIARGFIDLLELRTADPAFHPGAPQEVFDLDRRVFAVLRTARDGSSRVLVLINVSAERVPVRVPLRESGMEGAVMDLIEGRRYAETVAGGLQLQLEPYAIVWLTGGGM